MASITPRSRLKNTAYYVMRFVFRCVPASTANKDKWRNQFIAKYRQLIPEHERGLASSQQRTIRRAYGHADERAINYVEYTKQALPNPLPARLIAFYLPQFHTIPENDAWWGKGFTEWRNVTRALPQFEGHVQPRLPGDLGFYDLSNPEVMREQARLANEYGISAFCSYFYWFAGKILLETPLRNWLNDSTIDIELCLCWANENWSRRWDGRDEDVLIAQQHSPEDDIAFIEYVSVYLRDPRYLHVDGKPMLLLYRPGLLPDAKATTMRWRHWCLENGIGEIHLAYVQSFERSDPNDIGFDAAVAFPPNLHSVTSLTAKQTLINIDYRGEILDWRSLPSSESDTSQTKYRLYPGVCPSWDNEPRRPGAGRTFVHSAPRRYGDWLTRTIQTIPSSLTSSEKLVFINAWNEWAEGAVLEPDARYGYGYLQSTRQALIRNSAQSDQTQSTDLPYVVVIHAWFMDAFEEILNSLNATNIIWRIVVTTDPLHEAEVHERLNKLDMPSEVHTFENRGRDILPFLHVANRLLDEGVDVVLKLHTKKSEHLVDGDLWRKDLIAKLLGGQSPVKANLAFSNSDRLGILTPAGSLKHTASFIGANQPAIDFLNAVCGRLYSSKKNEHFVAGSMFWLRLESVRLLLDTSLVISDFELENVQIDGTLAHAVERYFVRCIEEDDISSTEV